MKVWCRILSNKLSSERAVWSCGGSSSHSRGAANNQIPCRFEIVALQQRIRGRTRHWRLRKDIPGIVYSVVAVVISVDDRPGCRAIGGRHGADGGSWRQALVKAGVLDDGKSVPQRRN